MTKITVSSEYHFWATCCANGWNTRVSTIELDFLVFVGLSYHSIPPLSWPLTWLSNAHLVTQSAFCGKIRGMEEHSTMINSANHWQVSSQSLVEVNHSENIGNFQTSTLLIFREREEDNPK